MDDKEVVDGVGRLRYADVGVALMARVSSTPHPLSMSTSPSLTPSLLTAVSATNAASACACC